MSVRTLSVLLLVLASALAGLWLGERYNVHPSTWLNGLSNGRSDSLEEDGPTFVQFRPSCFGRAEIHSCATAELREPKAIFPEMELLSSFDQRSRFAAAARGVGRIDFEVATATGKMMDTCSAFLISDHQIMTAYHCTLDLDGNKSKNITAGFFRLGYLGKGQVGQKYEISCTGAPPSPCVPVEGDHQLDFAIFELTSDAIAKARTDGVQPVKFASGLDKLTPSVGQDLFVVHHPYGREQFITRAACRVTRPIDPSTSQFYDTCATLGGSSGAPVFDEQSSTVIGMRIKGNKALAKEAGFLAAAVPIASLTSKSAILRELIGGQP